MKKWSLLINFTLFQLGWFACVLGGAYGMPWIGPLAVIAILAWHLKQAQQPSHELKLIGVAVVLGTLWDSLLVISGLLSYETGMLVGFLAPYWIIAMWALFSSTLNVSLRWLKNRYALSFLFGAAGGPLAYYAGFKLGAVDFSDMAAALLALAVGWALIMPLLMLLSNRYNGFVAEARTEH